FEIGRDRKRADRIGGQVIVVLDLALGPGDGEVVVLHPDRAFALHAEIGVELGPQAAGDGAQVSIRMVQLRIAERAVVGGTARLYDLGRSGKSEYRKGGGGENNVTHELQSLLIAMSRTGLTTLRRNKSQAPIAVPCA